MRTYLTLFSLTPDAWPGWIEAAQAHEDRVRAVIEAVGGTMATFHWTLGEYDGLTIYSVPDLSAAAAVSAGISAAGGIAHLCTTALLDSPGIATAAHPTPHPPEQTWATTGPEHGPEPSIARD